MNSYKKLIPAFFLIFLFSATYAAYLKNVPQKLTQPDGTIIHCFASGDEFHNWLHDSAGFTIMQDMQTGYYVYAISSGKDIIPSTYTVGTVNPGSMGLTPGINISAQAWEAKRAVFEQPQQSIRRQKAASKNEGVINNLAFFIRFADDTGYTATYNYLTEMYNDSSSWDANSLYNYYRTVSYGKMYIRTRFYPTPSGDIVLSYRDSFPRDYYKPYSETNTIGYSGSDESREREHSLLKRAVRFFSDSIPSSLNLDFNNDNRVDNICFIVTGDPEGWNSLLWPHRWSLYTGDSVMINGKRVYDYNFQIEGYSYPGVITHEMMHTLSAPDLYRYYVNTYYNPVGSWDLMASTNYPSPQGLSAYMKYQYGGWIDSIPEITKPGTYTLYPANGTSPQKIAYMFRPSNIYSEYIVLEYRKTNTNIFEGNLPGSGLLIYRINEEFEREGNASANDTTIFDEIYLYRPDGTTERNGDLTKANFARDYERTSFGLFTNPYPFNHKGYDMENISITDITEVGDSIQFTVNMPIDTLIVDVDQISLNCENKATNQFTINSNSVWTITHANAPWLEIDNRTGKGNSSIKVTAVSENTSSASRTGTIRVYPPSFEYSRDITVTQLPCNTNIEEIQNSTLITLYPNPAEGYLTITYPKINEPTNISIYSPTGQILYSSMIEDKEINIDISGFSSGIYYMKCYSKKQSIVKSFIVK